jgi:predicted transcriptional regulator
MGADLITAIFPRTRRQLLALLFTRADEAFFLREIVRAVGCGKGAVERELQGLTRAGILLREKRGNLTYYRANANCPIFPEIRALKDYDKGS